MSTSRKHMSGAIGAFEDNHQNGYSSMLIKSRFVPLVTSETSPQLRWYQSYPNTISGPHIIRMVVDEISLKRLDCLRETRDRLRRWLKAPAVCALDKRRA